jgi:outer membrane protein OmpA-like peptidoglycan-associated protein
LYTLKVDTTIDGLQLDRFSFSTLGLNPDQDIIKDFFFTFQSNSREFLELSKNLAKNNEASFTLIDSAKPVMPKSKKPPISNTTTKQKTDHVAIKEVKKDNTALTDVKKKEEKLWEEKSSSLAKNDSLKAIKNKDSLTAAKPLTEKKETGTATKKGTNKTEKEIEKQQENFFVQVKKNDSIPASKSIAVKPKVTVQKTSENASDSGHVKQTISVSDYKKKLSEDSLEKSETVKTDYKLLSELDEGSELIFVKENTIFYPPGKALLNKKGYAMLDKLVEEYKQTKNRKMLIEIFSDAAGEYSIKDYICRLRSEEIVKYLIRKGMTFDQMLVSIFGYKVLANECKRGVECSDEKHQENRRSRITIVENYKLEVGSK